MDEELKAKWLKALRSRKFKQARKKMVVRKDGVNRFCCLGVLERVCGTSLLQIKRNNSSLWVGNDLRGVDEGVRQQLANMNDGRDSFRKPHSFKEIADFIEKNL